MIWLFLFETTTFPTFRATQCGICLLKQKQKQVEIKLIKKSGVVII